MIDKRHVLAAAALSCGLAISPALAHDAGQGSSLDMRRADQGFAASVDNLKGMHVHDKSGQYLGTVRDVLFDPRDRKIDYLVLSSSDTSFAEKKYAVPFDSIRFDRSQNLLTLNAERDQLTRWEGQFYGVGPSYDRTTRDSSARAEFSQRRQMMHFTADELRGMHVIDSQGNDFGVVRDVTVDNATGRIDRLIVAAVPVSGAQEKFFAIPVDRLQYYPGERLLAVDMTRDQLYTSEHYGVAPESLSEEKYGATMENKTGQPPDHWELGGPPEAVLY